MPFPLADLNAIVTATLRERSKELADTMTAHNILLERMTMSVKYQHWTLRDTIADVVDWKLAKDLKIFEYWQE